MRSKEEANDYRYFPDPDLLPVVLEDAWIEEIGAALPELPAAIQRRFVAQYLIGERAAARLSSSQELADYFESAVAAAPKAAAKTTANWILGELGGALNKAGLDIASSPIEATTLGQMLERLRDGTLSTKTAKLVFDSLWAGDGTTDEIIAARGLSQVTNSGEIETLVDAAITANPGQVEQYRARQREGIRLLCRPDNEGVKRQG